MQAEVSDRVGVRSRGWKSTEGSVEKVEKERQKMCIYDRIMMLFLSKAARARELNARLGKTILRINCLRTITGVR